MSRAPSLCAFAATVLLGPLCDAATSLEPGYEPVTRAVRYADLNLTDNRAVATLYRRIKVAAQAVCTPEDSRGVEMLRHLRHCEQEAITRAVGDVNNPKLTNLHLEAINPMGLPQVR